MLIQPSTIVDIFFLYINDHVLLLYLVDHVYGTNSSRLLFAMINRDTAITADLCTTSMSKHAVMTRNQLMIRPLMAEAGSQEDFGILCIVQVAGKSVSDHGLALEGVLPEALETEQGENDQS